ncbi:MAG: hypothetical protein JWM68_1922 [Verrucomicrobiales bacterium]|nr:hypothetical protein [Verrucomicrobiales bacterium]
MTDIHEQLADYVHNGSEAAFRKIVEHYLDLVYATAARLVDNDAHRAQDVAQTVFINLAHQAKNLSKDVKIGGWLHRNTCFVAANVLRGERRRHAREREAMEMNAQTDHSEPCLDQLEPFLDEAINQLGAADRTAVLLRFYEKLDFRQLGKALGTTEAAAQKRVSRALEKLHLILRKRTAVCSVAILATALSANAASSAPAGLAATISGTALSSAAAGTGTTLLLLKLMAIAKFKTAIVTTVILASVMAPLLLEYRGEARVRAQNDIINQNANRLLQLTAENQRLSSLPKPEGEPLADNQLSEVLKLRSEVGRLRKTVQQMTPEKTAGSNPESKIAARKRMYAVQVERLKNWFETHPSEKIPEMESIDDETWIDAVNTLATDDQFAQAARIVRVNAQHPVMGALFGAARRYAAANHDQFPSDLSELKPYFKIPINDAILQRYEIVRTSSLIKELRPEGEWAITQKAPVNPELDIRMAYGLTGGTHVDERVTNRWSVVH